MDSSQFMKLNKNFKLGGYGYNRNVYHVRMIKEDAVTKRMCEESLKIYKGGKLMNLVCPECGSKQVLTNLNDRCCRKCGYRSENKEEFEVKE